MALDQLLAALEREASATIDLVLADARAEAHRQATAAAHDTERRRDLLVDPKLAELRAAMEQALGDAGRQARGDVLRARERLLARVFDAARKQLPAATAHAEYRASLPERIAAALGCLGDDDRAVLRCSAPLAATMLELVAARAGVSVEADDKIGSGFRLATTDGALEVDDTLESRLDANRTALSREVLRFLEPAA